MWPDPVNRALKHINPSIYVPMQGPSELGLSGALSDWDRAADLHRIEVPTLVIAARHDTMDPAHMHWMATAVKRGRYLYCPNGSHMALYDDQAEYMSGLIQSSATWTPAGSSDWRRTQSTAQTAFSG